MILSTVDVDNLGWCARQSASTLECPGIHTSSVRGEALMYGSAGFFFRPGLGTMCALKPA